jgi:hypothetical protein
VRLNFACFFFPSSSSSSFFFYYFPSQQNWKNKIKEQRCWQEQKEEEKKKNDVGQAIQLVCVCVCDAYLRHQVYMCVCSRVERDQGKKK